jgi:3-methyladenine DNA glycosylase AlkD
LSAPTEWSAPPAARELEAALRARGDPARAEEVRRYLKSDLEHLGVNVPALRQVARGLVKAHPGLTRRELLALVSSLWREPVFELRLATVELLALRGGLLRPEDLPLLRRLIRESGTWALVDGLAGTVVGRLVERFPAVADELDAWAQDDVFWVRRSALLALLGPLRRGEGDFARFSRYADGMLAEREFFIRKAIGWVLRETGKKRPDLVYHWLEPRIGRASGVTVREAVKYLPEDQRTRLLRAHRR